MMLEVIADIARQNEDRTRGRSAPSCASWNILPRRSRRRCAHKSAACTARRCARCNRARSSTAGTHTKHRNRSVPRRRLRRMRAEWQASSAVTRSGTCRRARGRSTACRSGTRRAAGAPARALPASSETASPAQARPPRHGCARYGDCRRQGDLCIDDACRETCGNPRPKQRSATSGRDWRTDRSASASAMSGSATRRVRGPIARAGARR